MAKKKAKKEKVEKKEYIVIRDVYERYGSGGRITKKVKIGSLVDYLAPYFIWTSDMDEVKEELAEMREENTDAEILEEWEMNNGDGMDYFEILNAKTGRKVFGGDERL